MHSAHRNAGACGERKWKLIRSYGYAWIFAQINRKIGGSSRERASERTSIDVLPNTHRSTLDAAKSTLNSQRIVNEMKYAERVLLAAPLRLINFVRLFILLPPPPPVPLPP